MHNFNAQCLNTKQTWQFGRRPIISLNMMNIEFNNLQKVGPIRLQDQMILCQQMSILKDWGQLDILSWEKLHKKSKKISPISTNQELKGRAKLINNSMWVYVGSSRMISTISSIMLAEEWIRPSHDYLFKCTLNYLLRAHYNIWIKLQNMSHISDSVLKTMPKRPLNGYFLFRK